MTSHSKEEERNKVKRLIVFAIFVLIVTGCAQSYPPTPTTAPKPTAVLQNSQVTAAPTKPIALPTTAPPAQTAPSAPIAAATIPRLATNTSAPAPPTATQIPAATQVPTTSTSVPQPTATTAPKSTTAPVAAATIPRLATNTSVPAATNTPNPQAIRAVAELTQQAGYTPIPIANAPGTGTLIPYTNDITNLKGFLNTVVIGTWQEVNDPTTNRACDVGYYTVIHVEANHHTLIIFQKDGRLSVDGNTSYGIYWAYTFINQTRLNVQYLGELWRHYELSLVGNRLRFKNLDTPAKNLCDFESVASS